MDQEQTPLYKAMECLANNVIGSIGIAAPDNLEQALGGDYRWDTATLPELRFYILVNLSPLQEFKPALAQHGVELYLWPHELQLKVAELALRCGLATKYPALEQVEL